MANLISAVWPGQPFPRGATWDGEGVNFSLFSAHADKVELCLFDPSGRREIQRIKLREQTDQIWHAYLPEARPGLLYGYRVHGPYAPEKGHRFNSNKLLVEPYAKHIENNLRWSDAHFGYRIGHPKADLSFDKRNSAPGMPRCRVIDPAFTWGDDRPPRVPWHDTVIYELHVRGFTMRHPEVPPALRGTYAGLSTKVAVDHLRRLGITTVELMPVHTFGGWPWEIPQMYLENSVIYHVRGATTPTLFLMGSTELSGADPTLSSQFLYTALKRQRVETRYVRYAEEGHGLFRPANRRDSVMRAVAWIDRHMGARSRLQRAAQ